MEGSNNLSEKFIPINSKYEDQSFIDIDIIDLFGLKNLITDNMDVKMLMKKLTTKYHNLSLKYHPDKFVNNDKEIINIKQCMIIVEEIKNGMFLSFINDIYNILKDIIKNDPSDLINIANGNISHPTDDFYDLKKKIERKPAETKADRPIHNIEKITEQKITDRDIGRLMQEEITKRNKLNIVNVFDQPDFDARTTQKFKEKFNNKFEETKETCDEQPANEMNLDDMAINTQIGIYIGNLEGCFGRSSNVTDLEEAFKPIKVPKKCKQSKTFDEYRKEREK